MSNRISNHIRSNLVAYLALFFALTGSAYALDGSNTVFSDDIVNNEVRSEDIRDSNVTATDLRANAVTTGKILDGEVRSTDVANDTSPFALTGTDVANGSLTGADLADDAITGAKVANDSLDGSDIQNLDGASIQGPEGWHRIGDPGEPAFLNGWQSASFAEEPGFYKDAVTRRVYLHGRINGGNSPCAFVLPPTHLPDVGGSSHVAYLGTSDPNQSADFVLVRVQSQGAVCVNRNGIGTGVHVSLDGISFRSG
jgi:hypothetical protein